ncbi:MAG: signal peptidase I [Eubacterium sp.]|nr:signal peptidase I [Eubacterium sp.]
MNLRFEEEMKKEKRSRIIKESLIFLAMALGVILLAWLIVTFCLQKVSVVGSTMESTLYNGEDVIVNKTSYLLFSPKRESIIAFYPETEEGQEVSESSILIRRIVGLPGETIQVKEGRVYVNGQALEEKYNYEAMQAVGVAGDEIKLGEDEYFVLCDNRTDLDDSRSGSFTKVKKDNIVGKVLLRVSPFSMVGGPDIQETEPQEEESK